MTVIGIDLVIGFLAGKEDGGEDGDSTPLLIERLSRSNREHAYL